MVQPDEAISQIDELKVAVVASHVSAKFGGETILPLHCFIQLLEKCKGSINCL